MSYWTFRRKVKQNVKNHIREIENELSKTQAPDVQADLTQCAKEHESVETVDVSSPARDDGDIESDDDISNDFNR